MKQISQGAEAKIYNEGSIIVKHRFAKSYRHPELDERLRKARTRREAKVIDKLQSLGFNSPKLIEFCDKEMKISMELIEGDLLKNIFDYDFEKLSKEIGRKIAILHTNNIIHGDLTTSNMILRNNELHFIDFGLSFFSNKDEDKAVDLHLLKQALESKHYSVFEEAFENVIKGYSEVYPEPEKIRKRLELVEKRGRYKKH